MWAYVARVMDSVVKGLIYRECIVNGLLAYMSTFTFRS